MKHPTSILWLLLVSSLSCETTSASSFLKLQSSSHPTSSSVIRRPRGGALLKKKATVATTKQLSKDIIPEGTATIPAEVFNLIKTIVGAGVLGLPAGIAAFGNQATAIGPAIVIMFFIGTLSAFGFSTVGTVCSETQATSYRQAWSRSVGPGSSWMPACKCFSMFNGPPCSVFFILTVFAFLSFLFLKWLACLSPLVPS